MAASNSATRAGGNALAPWHAPTNAPGHRRDRVAVAAQGTEASTIELLERHGSVARKLVHRLFRACRAPEQLYVTELSD